MTQNQLIQRTLKRVREHALFFLNVRVDNIDLETALETVHALASAKNDIPSRRVFFANVHSLHIAREDPGFRRCINAAEMVLPDGIGLKIAARLFGTRIVENLNGTDFAPSLFRYAETTARAIYLLGAHPDVLEACRRKLGERYPGLRIVGYHHGHFKQEEDLDVVKDINECQPDILMVALGSPLQEEWITSHQHQLRARVCFAVGGLFDFIAGRVIRAPQWIRRTGCEWLYRFFQDPKTKWVRVFVEIPVFIALLLAHRLLPERQHRFVTREVAVL